jgi:RimJ/RimL family protein N-acetyltransferase
MIGVGMGELCGKVVTLMPAVPGHVEDLKRILHTPEVEFRWGATEDADPAWPFDDPTTTRYAILIADTVVGMIQYVEEEEPRYRHASIDLYLEPSVHGQGIGRDAVRTIAEYLIEDRGHHRIVIDPAADNVAAIRCYTSVGFSQAGVLHQYERNADGSGWHDALLMELLADDVTSNETFR